MKIPSLLLFFFVGVIIGLIILILILTFSFEKKYQSKIYPGVRVDNIDFGGQEKSDVEKYLKEKNKNFDNYKLTLMYNQPQATISASELKIKYNTSFFAQQAYKAGRGGNLLADTYLKIKAAREGINFPVTLEVDDRKLTAILVEISKSINVNPKEALFQFSSGRVVAFTPSENGLILDIDKAQKEIYKTVINRKTQGYNLPTKIIYPKVTTEKANSLGIKELIGRGSSSFYHSIENRVYNVGLAASRLNGILIPPGNVFSFNDAVGDISGLTGYKQAYIIKDGKTILGDGGGVCQVSTTLFRAALNAGLPVTERWAHAYRVGYYEQDSPPGIDATVYAPSNDLKIKNDTDSYILIQNTFNAENLTLSFELYGQKDGRIVSLTKPQVWGQTPPPPDLYQDDPTLPKGIVKQVDFAASGAKTSFDYKVEKGGKITFQTTFYSNYRPWQAVYLKGTKE